MTHCHPCVCREEGAASHCPAPLSHLCCRRRQLLLSVDHDSLLYCFMQTKGPPNWISLYTKISKCKYIYIKSFPYAFFRRLQKLSNTAVSAGHQSKSCSVYEKCEDIFFPEPIFFRACSAGIAIRIVSFLSHANVFCQTYSHFIHFGAKTSHFTFYLAAIHSG